MGEIRVFGIMAYHVVEHVVVYYQVLNTYHILCIYYALQQRSVHVGGICSAEDVEVFSRVECPHQDP